MSEEGRSQKQAIADNYKKIGKNLKSDKRQFNTANPNLSGDTEPF